MALTLSSPLTQILTIKSDTKFGLQKLGIHTVRDLLYHFPTRYADASEYVSIAAATPDTQTTIHGVIQKIQTKKTFTSKIPATYATISDMSGTIEALWLNQPYIGKMFFVGQNISLSGKIHEKNGKRTLMNPSIAKDKVLAIDSADSLFGTNRDQTLTPIYKETKHVSSLWITHAIAKILPHIKDISDPIPDEYRLLYNLPPIYTALIWAHTPKTKEDALVARKRFSFEELFSIQVSFQKEKKLLQKQSAYQVHAGNKEIQDIVSRFPFIPSHAQARTIQDIAEDLRKDSPMSRLLEGDVGSGKTAVAAVAAYVTAMSRPGIDEKKQTFGNLQVAYMAPTELLATQHFETFIELFAHTGMQIALITGSGCRKFPTKVASSQTPWTDISKPQLRKWIANGEIPIVIGTHALIQKTLIFKHLALVIIDEQHRFGLAQRQALAKKDTHYPHLLSMTATPIPRSLALTVYGNLDLSVIDEMPKNRKAIITNYATAPKEREKAYEHIRTLLEQGRQAYIICPRIAESDPEDSAAMIMKSVISEAKRLKDQIFPKYRIGILHSKMTKEKKESAMEDFAQGTIDILVATSVVEVGINVPNATSIIIEGAERFGLSQLHQLRGRVMRSHHQPYCYLFSDSNNEKSATRLKKFLEAKNGFELAEYDLEMRGAGELTGSKQWGMSDIGMEALKNPRLVEFARKSAIDIVSKNETLAVYPALVEKIKNIGTLHFE
jgi:ATP-dependent DNA helicase RecG